MFSNFIPQLTSTCNFIFEDINSDYLFADCNCVWENFYTFHKTTFMRQILFLTIALFIFTEINAQSSKSITSAGMTIDLPVINNGSFYDYESHKTSNESGYLGAGVSLFYRNQKNEFTIGLEHPLIKKSLFPPKGGYSDAQCDIFETTVRHKISGNVAIIGGLNYSIYRFHAYTDIPGIPDIDKKDETIGLTTGAEVLMSKNTSLSLTYRPSLFAFEQKSYRHILSLGFRFHINFWKKQN